MNGPAVDEIFADDALAGDAAWMLGDHQESVRAVVNNAAAPLGTVVYDAFGAVVIDTRSVDRLFGYTGRELDAETGLQYNRARYYNPQTGRFLSEDSLGFAAGDWNLYRYAANDPISNTDPSGHSVRSPVATANPLTTSMPSAFGSYSPPTLGGVSSIASPSIFTSAGTGSIPSAHIFATAPKFNPADFSASGKPMDPTTLTRVAGLAQAVGGAITAGLSLFAMTVSSPTVVGAVGWGSLAVHAADSSAAGFRQFRTGIPQETTLHRALSSATGSPPFATGVETGVDLLTPLAAGRAIKAAQALQAPKIVAPTPMSNATTSSNVLRNANFAQRTFSETFSTEGKFAGQTIDDVAGALRNGALSPSDVPIQYINRDGNILILNTRSAQALQRAGVPRSEWKAVNMTGSLDAEARLTGQLSRNRLTSEGIPNVQPGKE